MPRTSERVPATMLSALFASPAMARLVVFFALHAGARVHLRELERRTGLATSSLQNELRRLTRMGVLTRIRERGRVVYAADEGHDAWRGWRLLIRACADPADVLREVFAGKKEDVDAAFVYGSRARGDARPDSDVDVFLVGDPESTWRLRETLSEAESLIGRELDVIEYTRAQLAERVRSGNAFVARVLREPKRWLAGSAASLALAGAG